MLLLVGLVVSHWILDLVTHDPDLPLWPGRSPRFGFGLWQSIPGTYIVEGGLWIAAIGLYLSQRRPCGLVGPIALWSFIGLSTLMWASSPIGAPPPSVTALGWLAMIGWITPFWAAAADRHYAPRASQS